MTDRIRSTIAELFKGGGRDFTRRLFPERSSDLQDQPELTLAVLGLETPKGDPATTALMEAIVRECGSSGRTFKSAVIFAVPEAAAAGLHAAARRAELAPLRDALRQTEKQLEALAAQRSATEARLAEPDFYARTPVAEQVEMQQRHGRLSAEIDALESRWLELSEQLDAAD